jgi:hypothetical protein
MVRVRCSASRGGAARARRAQRKTPGALNAIANWGGEGDLRFSVALTLQELQHVTLL